MPEHVFREVHPHEFEQHIQRAPQTDLDQERDYTGKKTYLNQDNTVGYSLRDDGYWGNLFSLVKGGGRAATQDAIARGALWGTAFERPGSNNLIEYYKGVGMRPFAREKNWDEGGPDVVHVKFGHAPVPEEIKQKIEQGIAQPEGEMVKTERRTIFSLMRKAPHPHAYEWHDGHTLHHKVMVKADLADEADVGKQFQHQLNEQVATVGVPTYIEYAKHYGTINKAIAPHDSAYNYRGLSDKINDLIKQHGYEVYYAGGKYGKADLANKNYDTKHLMIYDPSPESGTGQGDIEQTDNWRKVHELAHALTRDAVNNAVIPGFGDARYGERPRMGRLGKQRTLRDAMRAIHWEALAVQKQRELSEQLGVKIPDEAFNMEWNTNQHDATHRAVTGRFSEPRKEGFHPSSEPVPLEFSLGLARKAAEQMGMKGLDDLKGMSKSEQVLAKTQGLLKTVKELPKVKDIMRASERVTPLAPDEKYSGFTYRIQPKQDGHKLSIYHNGQLVGAVGAITRGTDLPNYETHASVVSAEVIPEYRGKGLYPLALQRLHEFVVKHGAKGLKSQGFQRSSSAGKAWLKLNPRIEPDKYRPNEKRSDVYYLDPDWTRQSPTMAKTQPLDSLENSKGMAKSESNMHKYEKSQELLKACWKRYKMVGTKEKDGETVPNCVPKKKAEEELDKDEKKYSKKVTNPETGREKTVKYGAKGYTIAPGTSRGDSYCARSAGQMKDHPAAAKDPNSPLRLSRKKWKCSGSKSTKKSEEDVVEVDPAEYLAKAQELLVSLQKATPSRTGHITFPLLGRDPQGQTGKPRDPAGVKGDPQKHVFPVIDRPRSTLPIVPPEKIGDRMRRVSLFIPGRKTPESEIKEVRENAAKFGQANVKLYSGGEQQSSGIHFASGIPGGKASKTTGGIIAPPMPLTPEGRQQIGRSIAGTEMHEAHHDIASRLTHFAMNYRGPIYHHLGEHVLKPVLDHYKKLVQQQSKSPSWLGQSPELQKMGPLISMIQTLTAKAAASNPPAHVSPNEEIFAYMHNYMMDPAKRELYHQSADRKLGRATTVEERRDVFKQIEKMFRTAQAEAATIDHSKAEKIRRTHQLKFQPSP